MRRSTITSLALAGIGLIFASFLIRGFGQLLLGPRTALGLAGPVALLAAGVVLFVSMVWALAWLGLISLEGNE